MKIAKATADDLAMASDLANAFDSLTRTYIPRDLDGMIFDSDDDKECGRVLRHLLEIVNRGSLHCVVLGMHVMLDPANRCVDPKLNYIEHHPDVLAGFNAKRARPLADWHQDMGNVLWWRFPIDEPPYVGSPRCSDWPGYHTHFTPLLLPDDPMLHRVDDAEAAAGEEQAQGEAEAWEQQQFAEGEAQWLAAQGAEEQP